MVQDPVRTLPTTTEIKERTRIWRLRSLCSQDRRRFLASLSMPSGVRCFPRCTDKGNLTKRCNGPRPSFEKHLSRNATVQVAHEIYSTEKHVCSGSKGKEPCASRL